MISKKEVLTKIQCTNDFKFARIYFRGGGKCPSAPLNPSPTPMIVSYQLWEIKKTDKNLEINWI